MIKWKNTTSSEEIPQAWLARFLSVERNALSLVLGAVYPPYYKALAQMLKDSLQHIVARGSFIGVVKG